MLQHIGYRKGDDKPSKWTLAQSVLSIYPMEEGNTFSHIPLNSFSAKEIKQVSISKEDERTYVLLIRDAFEKVELLGSEQVLKRWICEINNCKMDWRNSISRSHSKNLVSKNTLVEGNKRLFLFVDQLEINSKVKQIELIDSQTITETDSKSETETKVETEIETEKEEDKEKEKEKEKESKNKKKYSLVISNPND